MILNARLSPQLFYRVILPVCLGLFSSTTVVPRKDCYSANNYLVSKISKFLFIHKSSPDRLKTASGHDALGACRGAFPLLLQGNLQPPDRRLQAGSL